MLLCCHGLPDEHTVGLQPRLELVLINYILLAPLEEFDLTLDHSEASMLQLLNGLFWHDL